jgi:hypothetical protein
VDTNQEWFTYMVSDVPTRLTDFHGNEINSDSLVSDEIETQTGLKPVSVRTTRQTSDNSLVKTLLVSFLRPRKRYWSLFGSRVARLLDKTNRLNNMKHAGATIMPATVIEGQSADAVARQVTSWTIVLHRSSASTAWALTWPVYTSVRLGRGKCTAPSVDSQRSNDSMSEL